MFRWIMGLVFLLSGCAIFPPNPQGFRHTQIETEYLTFSVWEKETIQPKQPIRLYFEGDGNPNPRHQVALHYAQQDPSNNIVYIARACQWSPDKICKKTPAIYQEHRFHPEIIREMEELVLLIMNKYQATSVEFVGYDGGATIAMDIATHIRPTRIITIAGILDLNAYSRVNDIEIMADALNPADKIGSLANIKQIHYVGTEDDTVPPRIAERFVQNMKNPKSAIVKKVKGVGHTNWSEVSLDY